MNTPNKLTVIRIVLAPVFLLLFLCDFPFHYVASILVFTLAAITDYFDGNIARKHNLITNFGKFLDPLADKILTTSAFLGFLAIGKIDVWVVMLILSREFMVTSVRLIAAKDGVIVAAGFLGKFKTVAQFVAIIFMLTALEFSAWQTGLLNGINISKFAFVLPIYIGYGLVWVSAALTVVSGFKYVWELRHYFVNDK